MSLQKIDNGTFLNDPSAESVYSGFGKVNEMLIEVYNRVPGLYPQDIGFVNISELNFNIYAYSFSIDGAPYSFRSSRNVTIEAPASAKKWVIFKVNTMGIISVVESTVSFNPTKPLINKNTEKFIGEILVNGAGVFLNITKEKLYIDGGAEPTGWEATTQSQAVSIADNTNVFNGIASIYFGFTENTNSVEFKRSELFTAIDNVNTLSFALNLVDNSQRYLFAVLLKKGNELRASILFKSVSAPNAAFGYDGSQTGIWQNVTLNIESAAARASEFDTVEFKAYANTEMYFDAISITSGSTVEAPDVNGDVLVGSSLLSKSFTYNSGAQTFTADFDIVQVDSLLVGNTPLQRDSQYSVSGAVVTILDTLTSGAVIELNYWKANAVNATNYTKAESDALALNKIDKTAEIQSFMSLTQDSYDAITNKSDTTIYFIE